MGGGSITVKEEYDNSTSDVNVTDMVQVEKIEEKASNVSKDYLVDSDDMDISVQEEDK